MKKFASFILCFFLFSPTSFALREGAFDLTQVFASSKYVFIGQVISTKEVNPTDDEAKIKVVSSLKGKQVSEFTLRYLQRHLKPEDRTPRTFTLNRGESGIFFLKSLQNGEGTLTHWGSFAIFRAPFYVPQN